MDYSPRPPSYNLLGFIGVLAQVASPLLIFPAAFLVQAWACLPMVWILDNILGEAHPHWAEGSAMRVVFFIIPITLGACLVAAVPPLVLAILKPRVAWWATLLLGLIAGLGVRSHGFYHLVRRFE